MVYVIISQEYMETVNSMEINEGKQYGVYKAECQNKQIKKKYSDHNVILINIDFISSKYVSRIKKVITRKGHNKYQIIIQEVEISKGEIQESYNT